MTAEVTVLGAGVAGLCVAHELAARGAAVRLLDPAGGPGPEGCSWWAGGMLAPFCEGETAEEPVVRLGAGAADWWRAAGAAVTAAGTLVVALGRDRGELDRFARRTRGHRRVTGGALAELEPDLAGRVPAALHVADEAQLDPRAALATLRDGLAARGVRVATEGTPRGTVIDCRGLAARDRLPGLRGVRGEMAVLRAPDIALRRTVRLLHPRHPLYLVPRGDGVYMLGATQIESAGRGPATLRSVAELLNAAYALHPAFAEAEVLEIGADARPAFPDNLPRIVREDDRIHVNGLFRHGFLLAPALARMVAALVLDGEHPELLQ
ncbi:FAD-dependent oxidoreductase [Psychromarinibacter sp. C21-152]|uniref:FAD-dependent oxidoreductase n=1 Tax=Psychromarinibacter sediminicola TaxID=3033385 RepID=A0AAE3T9I3_9RHOB|nr:FAD-dependent oxidoreductase [Psychromarinibacter sediminicola]MDF0600550.1 FAD-dependent oxidoreductase [Psychromarinibacter sediminicola]